MTTAFIEVKLQDLLNHITIRLLAYLDKIKENLHKNKYILLEMILILMP